jgi:hypothetical protein
VTIAAFALAGALAGGGYGIVHDQITYTIAPEYFTKFKFHQFAWANAGLPTRGFVAEVGFLATWWVGAFAASILAALALFRWGQPVRVRKIFIGFGIVACAAIVAGTIGGVLGYHRRFDPDFGNWQGFVLDNGVVDLPAFVNVGYIHNASYLGGLAGLLAAIVFVLISRKKQT